MQPIYLIHPFQVNSDRINDFLNAWEIVDQYMKKQRGFLETKLHRALNYNDLPAFNFINIATWENANAFRNAISNNNFKSLAKHVLEFSRGPGLYEIFKK